MVQAYIKKLGEKINKTLEGLNQKIIDLTYLKDNFKSSSGNAYSDSAYSQALKELNINLDNDSFINPFYQGSSEWDDLELIGEVSSKIDIIFKENEDLSELSLDYLKEKVQKPDGSPFEDKTYEVASEYIGFPVENGKIENGYYNEFFEKAMQEDLQTLENTFMPEELINELIISKNAYDSLIDEDKEIFKQYIDPSKNIYVNNDLLKSKAKVSTKNDLIDYLITEKAISNLTEADAFSTIIDEAYVQIAGDYAEQVFSAPENILMTMSDIQIKSEKNALDYLFVSFFQQFMFGDDIQPFLDKKVDGRAFCNYNPKTKSFVYNSEKFSFESLDYEGILNIVVDTFKKYQDSIEKPFFEELDKLIAKEKTIKNEDIKLIFDKMNMPAMNYLIKKSISKIKALGFKKSIYHAEGEPIVYTKDSDLINQGGFEEIEFGDKLFIGHLWDTLERTLSCDSRSSLTKSISRLSSFIEDDKKGLHDVATSILKSGFSFNETYKKLSQTIELSLNYLTYFDNERLKKLNNSFRRDKFDDDEINHLISGLEYKVADLSPSDVYMISQVNALFDDIDKDSEDLAKKTAKKIKSIANNYREEKKLEVLKPAIEELKEKMVEEKKKAEEEINDSMDFFTKLAKKRHKN